MRLTTLITLNLIVASAVAQDVQPPSGLPPTVEAGAQLTEVFSDGRFYEGPMWDPAGGKLYFTAFGVKNQVMRLDASGTAAVWMDDSKGANGTWLTRDGRILTVQGNGKAVISAKLGTQGPEDVKVVAADEKWVAPNDVCQTPSGNIYFTDPDFKDRKRSSVFLVKPDGKVHRVVTDMPVPNGCITSLDGKTLYLSDSHLLHWRAYPIKVDGGVGEGRVFFDPGVDNKSACDGMSIDEHGNLYLTGRGGVWAVSPQGKSLGFIPVPVFVSNATFGGPDGKTLYLTCDKKVYSLKMNVRGGRSAR